MVLGQLAVRQPAGGRPQRDGPMTTASTTAAIGVLVTAGEDWGSTWATKALPYAEIESFLADAAKVAIELSQSRM